MKLAVRNHKRDEEILRLRDELHWTYTKIGIRFNISKARARELYIRIANDRANKAMGTGE